MPVCWSTRERDGAQSSAIPVVPWPQLMTGQPPSGGVPEGSETTPETATGSPFALVERYRTRWVLPPIVGPSTTCRDQMSVPWRPSASCSALAS